MCKIKLKETFRMNVGLHDLSKKSYVRKNVLKKSYFFKVSSGRPTFILKVS